jgi:hypothetical protein
MIFWDTSALLRCYDEEEPTHPRAKNLLLEERGHKGSSLLSLEAMSGIVRRLKSRKPRKDLLGLVKSHLQHFDLVPLDQPQVERAARLVERAQGSRCAAPGGGPPAGPRIGPKEHPFPVGRRRAKGCRRQRRTPAHSPSFLTGRTLPAGGRDQHALRAALPGRPPP